MSEDSPAKALEIMYRSGNPARTAIIYQGEIDFISRCILDYPDIETGGQLFGFWTAAGVPVVLYAIGPGPRANHQTTFFNQDVDYLVRVGHILASRFGLQHIGEWHSHHQLRLAHPSAHDASTIVHGINRQNLGRFLLCIGICAENASVLNAFNFTQDAGFDFVHSAWDIKPGESPYRVAVDSWPELKQFLMFPKIARACHGALKTVFSDDYRPPLFDESYWLNEKSNNKVLKDIVDMLAEKADGNKCMVKIDSQKIVHLAFSIAGHETRVTFPYGFPETPPIIVHDCAVSFSPENKWEYSGDIATAFMDYFTKNTPNERCDNGSTETNDGNTGAERVPDTQSVQVP